MSEYPNVDFQALIVELYGVSVQTVHQNPAGRANKPNAI